MELLLIQKRLPLELVREIYSYDPTYHNYVRSEKFKRSLLQYTLCKPYWYYEWSIIIVETLLHYTVNNEFDWYNEWGGVFENTGGYASNYWHFFNHERFRVIFECGNYYMKFKVVPNVQSIRDVDYLENSITFDGIICDFVLHNKLCELNKEQKNRYFQITSEWEDRSNLKLRNLEYIIPPLAPEKHYIWYCIP